MARFTDAMLLKLLTWAKRLKSTRLVQRMLQRLRNREEFDDLKVHERMLADHARINAYDAAIKDFIQPNDTVVELGAGTGFLSILAKKQGAAPVYAVDHSPLIHHAQKVAEHNNISGIYFHERHSTTFQISSKVDVLLQEQFGDFLFDEGVLDNIADLRDRLLKEGGKILPNRCQLFLEPVEMKKGRLLPFAWDMRVKGIDFSLLKGAAGEAGAHRLVSYMTPGAVETFLCEKEPVLIHDLHTDCSSCLPKELVFSRRVVRPGRLDGFLLYFEADFYGKHRFSSGPGEERASNWAYWLFRVQPEELAPGRTIHAHVNTTSWLNPWGWTWRHRVDPLS